MSEVVLIVEDEALIRLAAVELVESAGYVALEAGNADAAIALLEARDDIALVFTDIDMPGSMDGIGLARAIRDRWPPVALLVVSGMKLVAGNELPGGAQFFSKPYADAHITEAIAGLLGPAYP